MREKTYGDYLPPISTGFSQLSAETVKPDGHLVIPVGDFIFYYTKFDDGRYREEEYSGFRFVPLIVE